MIRAAGNRGKILAVAALAALAVGVIVFVLSGTDPVAVPQAVHAPAVAPAVAPARPFLAQPAGAEAADPAQPVAPEADPVACAACEKQHIASGDCEPDSGCDDLTGTDKELCQNLLACQRRTGCWAKHPLDCLCGSAHAVECAKGAANGECRAEIQAATKTTDPVKNGTLFYDPTVPAGRANRLIACAYDNCKTVCAPTKTAQN